MLHILERFVIHVASSAFLLLIVYFALRFWYRTNSKLANWISGRQNHMLVLSAMIVFACAPLREIWDTAAGQSLVKGVFDQISWLLGPSLAAWGLYRFKKER